MGMSEGRALSLVEYQRLERRLRRSEWESAVELLSLVLRDCSPNERRGIELSMKALARVVDDLK